MPLPKRPIVPLVEGFQLLPPYLLQNLWKSKKSVPELVISQDIMLDSDGQHELSSGFSRGFPRFSYLRGNSKSTTTRAKKGFIDFQRKWAKCD